MCIKFIYSQLSSTDQCLQSAGTRIDFSDNRKLTCLIRDGIIQRGDDNLEMTLKVQYLINHLSGADQDIDIRPFQS